MFASRVPSRLPWAVAGVALCLAGLGLAGVHRAGEFGGGPRSFQQQIVWLCVAALICGLVARVHYERWGRVSYLLFVGAVVLLAAVYWFPPINGARRWIRLGAIGFQPSEFAKVVFVLALARYLRHRQSYRRIWGLLAPLAITVIPVTLILKEPDLGTSLVFLPVWFVMLFVAGARRIDLAACVLAGLLLAPPLWVQMSREQRSRVTALFEQTAPGQSPADDSYQLHQGKQMLALGGVWGSWLSGPAADDPAVYVLPEARCDFIFCVLGERFGLWGLGLVLLLFCALAALGQRIALLTEDPFGRLAAVGLSSLIAVQALINAGMNVGLLPVTGVSLPLVSYGGSGLAASGAALGLLMSVGFRPRFDAVGEPFLYKDEG